MRSQLSGLRLQKEEIAAEAIALYVKQPSEQPIELGVYHLVWSRSVNEQHCYHRVANVTYRPHA